MRDRVSTVQVLAFVLAILVVMTGAYVWYRKEEAKALVEILKMSRNCTREQWIELQKSDPDFLWKMLKADVFLGREDPKEENYLLVEARKDGLLLEDIWGKRFVLSASKISRQYTDPAILEGIKQGDLSKYLKPGYVLRLQDTSDIGCIVTISAPRKAAYPDDIR